MMHSFAWWPTVVVLGVATFTDLRSRRIPNWLVLPFLVAGFVVSGWLHGWHGLGQSLGGAALGLVIYGFLFWMGGMGAGDVKLCTAIGAWIGPSQMSAAGMSILLMTGMISRSCSRAMYMLDRVWASTPWVASMRRRAPSQEEMARDTS